MPCYLWRLCTVSPSLSWTASQNPLSSVVLGWEQPEEKYVQSEEPPSLRSEVCCGHGPTAAGTGHCSSSNIQTHGWFSSLPTASQVVKGTGFSSGHLHLGSWRWWEANTIQVSFWVPVHPCSPLLHIQLSLQTCSQTVYSKVKPNIHAKTTALQRLLNPQLWKGPLV